MPHESLIKPTHKAIQAYYQTLRAYGEHFVGHEGALRSAFQNLLADLAKARHWVLVPEDPTKVGGKTVRPDGTLRDEFNLRRGYWEAKDTDDDLDAEISKKIKKGYPLTNIIFEDTRQGILYQGKRDVFRADLADPQALADLLNQFFGYIEPEHEDFDKAVVEFKERVPDLARGLADKIKKAHEGNPRFQTAFDKFFTLCQSALNPNISQAAVDEMLVQHLLTERLIRKIFDQQDFTRRNVIAAEVEKVIDALVSRSFNRDDFQKSLDRFYVAIENAAHTLPEFGDKQAFLNTVYERFFQGYSIKLSDTHGIVYTPQAIVNFMCASVAEVLQTEFGKKLGDQGVNILDPCTGTGNFIVNLLRRMPKRDLPRMYKEQLFANEVMLLPYYIAALNIEHAYYELTGAYEPFEGLCFVDTLDLAEGKQLEFGFMTEENTARVKRQKETPITVIIGNPPYNVGQINENDNNKNRKYDVIDSRVKSTYGKDSAATSVSKINDPYVKFFRWAVDRLGDRDGVVCFVSNNSFVEQIAFDGMRKHLMEDFTRIYHLHLEGNVRKNPNLAGTIYNVFGIQVGVGITVAIRSSQHRNHHLYFEHVEKTLRKEAKLAWLIEHKNINGVAWQSLTPNQDHTWLVPEHAGEFSTFLPLGTKVVKSSKPAQSGDAVFRVFGLGVSTHRDDMVYDFSLTALINRVKAFIEDYNSEVDRYRRSGAKTNPDEFVRYDKIKWAESLKLNLTRGRYAKFSKNEVRNSLYRPFVKKLLYFNDILNERRYQFPQILPTPETEKENRLIWVKTGTEWPMFALVSREIVDLLPQGGSQCFPFYIYDEDGSNRQENITDWALKQFRDHCADKKISKWDIFYYVYGLLHHPGYREKFADNLKRELPRIPFAPDFRTFAKAGKELAQLHLDYEKLKEYPLKWIESPEFPLSYRVDEKMRLSSDKKSLAVNASLMLGDIPPETFQYRLGNRSALEWVIDQYQVSEDKRSGIRSDPNRADDPEYIVRLVGQVVRVSVETVRIVKGLPPRYCP